MKNGPAIIIITIHVPENKAKIYLIQFMFDTVGKTSLPASCHYMKGCAKVFGALLHA